MRLGRRKALVRVGSQTLLQRTVSRLAVLGGEILVVIGQGQPEPSLPGVDARVVTDLYPGRSALGGIYTGLVASASPYNVMVACDMPLLNPSLLEYLAQLAPGFDAVVPRVQGNIEPLHAVYSKSCLAVIQQQMEQGNLRIRDVLNAVRVRYVAEEEIDRFDPERLSFFNINTAADLKRARELLGE